MPDDPFPHPTRSEPRGEFPDHDDRPGRAVLTLDEAKRRARERLEKWRRDHG